MFPEKILDGNSVFLPSDVPDWLIEKCSVEICTSFKQGASVFFEPLKLSQPRTFEALSRLNYLYAVYTEVENFKIFVFVVENKQKHVLIPPRNPWDDHYWDEYLATVPSPLRCYYSNFSGMSIPNDDRIFNRYNFNLPERMSVWTDVDDDLLKSLGLKKGTLKKITKDFNGDLLKVILHNRSGDLLLINFTTPSEYLIHVKEGNFDDYFVLENPGPIVDEYCSQVIVTNTTDFNFRR